jgi:integrase
VGPHIEGDLGSARLDELTPLTLEHWKANLLAAGVGVESVKRSLVLLQGVLQRAVEWQYLASNPARLVRKPPSGRRRAVRPVAPETIERMRASLIAEQRPGDALLVRVLAYCGLRPGEALALTWAAVGARRVLVESCVSLGEIKGTKTGRIRSVQLIEPMADDSIETGTVTRTLT